MGGAALAAPGRRVMNLHVANDYEQAVLSACRTIAGAEFHLQLSVLRNMASYLSRYVAGGHLEKSDTIDRLYSQARSVGLIARCGEDAVQKALADGLTNAGRLARAAKQGALGGENSGPKSLYRNRFSPVAIDDVQIPDTPTYLIDGIIPDRGLVFVVGPPKSRKSFLVSDMLFAVARGVPYAGRKTMAGPVIYCTGEGVSGFRRRLVAMRRHYGVEGAGVPFWVIENVPDLGSGSTADLGQFLADINACVAENRMEAPRAIALDTLARCMGDGDENTAKDMGRFVNRCGEIERHFGCVVPVVHHMGKDASKGGRGSNVQNGAGDVTITVEKCDSFSTARIHEMKDGIEGQEWRFRLLPYDVGARSEEGGATSSATSTCVVEIVSEPAVAQPSATKLKKQPSGVAGDLLKVIRRAVYELGEMNVGSVAVPDNVRAVSRSNLKNYCATMSWQSEGEPNAFRAMLSKTLSSLRAKDLIGFDKEWVWLT
jgi:hypothetical protein